jgi:hypothetical protein
MELDENVDVGYVQGPQEQPLSLDHASEHESRRRPHGPLPSRQGPTAQTPAGRRDLPSTSSVLTNMAHRLVMA